jgi:radical SAM protein with 4Fe4S-binding SPASM domain
MAVHEGATGVKGSHDKTINAFRLLRQRNINTIVKCTFTQQNISQFDNLKEFARSIGSRFLFSFTLIPQINGAKDILKLRLSEEQLKKVFASRDWLVQDISTGGVACYKPLCAAGINSMYISPYGEVFACVVLREPCGNLKDEPLEKIWHSPFLKKLRGIRFEDLKGCAGCGLSGYCDRCAGLAWLEANELLGPSPNDCTLAKVRSWAVARRNDEKEKQQKKILQEAGNSL